jgi:hypothetical protein
LRVPGKCWRWRRFGRFPAIRAGVGTRPTALWAIAIASTRCWLTAKWPVKVATPRRCRAHPTAPRGRQHPVAPRGPRPRRRTPVVKAAQERRGHRPLEASLECQTGEVVGVGVSVSALVDDSAWASRTKHGDVSALFVRAAKRSRPDEPTVASIVGSLRLCQRRRRGRGWSCLMSASRLSYVAVIDSTKGNG